jgi:two-component system response regulator YesN
MKEIQAELLKTASQKKQMGRILSKAFKGFLNSFLLHGGCLETDFNYYNQCLNPENNPVLCLLLQPEISDSTLLNFAIENISEELLSDFSVLGSITINNHFLIILTAHDIILLKEAIQNIKKTFRSFYQCELRASLSSEGSFHDIPKLYHEVLGNSMYHYYVSAEIIITPNTVKKYTAHKNPEITTDMKNIQDAILQFDEASALQALHQIFSLLYATTITIPNLRKEVLNLYFMIVQQQRDNSNPIDTAVVSRLMSQDSLHSSYDLLCKCIHNTIEENKQKLVMPKEDIIAKIQCLVDLHLSENTFSLKWIAQQIYMSENYLGKFFYKATGQKFTQYLTTKRINRAKQMIQADPYVKLTTLCKSLGFENNPAYFSTLFKNVTGQTITEYKKLYLPKEAASCILK